jgi:hypothetical protein
VGRGREASVGTFRVLALILLTAHLSPLTSSSPPLAAQTWNTAGTLSLVQRAVERHELIQADSSLRSYRTRAHGFLFFLAQVGEGLNQPPRLVKADELQVEVYWKEGRSRQVILGWRDGRFLPTDIAYHRDHLGIVTNNFGNTIRIGEGDEVRDVVHPLSPEGLVAYDFALVDSAAIRTAQGEVTVYQIEVRPRSFSHPLVVGTLYLDVASAELVRFRFSFTPAAYLDRQLEDISVVLENARYENRYWLPRRQEIEIRRRATWLDFPARGIIRGRWEIGDYDLNQPIPPEVLAGPAIGGLFQPSARDSIWSETLERAIAGVAQPVNRQDMDALRAEVERIAASRRLSGLPNARLAAGSLSDMARVNRVQGLTLGFGGRIGVAASRFQVQPMVGYGTSDDRLTGSLTVGWSSGSWQLSLQGYRQIRDLSDWPVIAPLMNSILAQEDGKDHGDYLLLHWLGVGVRHRISGRSVLGLELGREASRSVTTTASPATGSYRPNPPLGSGSRSLARLTLERGSGGIALRRDLWGRLSLEGGSGSNDYLRVAGDASWSVQLRGTELLTRAWLGAGTDGLPPHRSFVLGGRGTLVGEPFRAYGGRTAGLLQLEWRLPVPVPAIELGSFASTGKRMILAPFLAAGLAAHPLPSLPWGGSDGIRAVGGVAIELFMRLIRIEAGVGLRDGHFGITVDVNRDWWGLL